ncbi:MAG TPA: L,D-transpeptidase [Gemmatimonadaceae bacterium]|nr:L,D-transpeptidase [Gemmatimonadaceae bacterium]
MSFARALLQPFRDNPAIAGALTVLTLGLAVGSGFLLTSTAKVRLRRDINRIVFNRNWDLLDQVTKRVGSVNDSLENALAATPPSPVTAPYIVVSIEDRRLWYKHGDTTLYTAPVAVGSGKTLIKTAGGHEEIKFDTPRGQLTVKSKEIDPIWVPPDWHYEEQATEKKLGVMKLARGQTIEVGDGTSISIEGNDVVRLYPDGRALPLEASEGHEIVAQKNIIIPPFGTNQRKYLWVLGGHRLNLGDGYGIHGTNEPKSIGEAVSHGCVRLRNEDIAYLYTIVPIGTQVYIY